MVHKAAVNDVYPLEGSCILVTGQGSSSLPCATVKVDDLTVATSLRAMMGGQKDSEVGPMAATNKGDWQQGSSCKYSNKAT